MKRILVTRPLAQNASLVQALQQRGEQAVVLPLLAIEIFNESEHLLACNAIKSVVQRLDEFQHLIFTSTNAVDAGWIWIDRYWPQLPAGQHWYAIGAATAAALRRQGIPVQETTGAMNSETLLQHPFLQQVQGDKVLIVRGEGGRHELRQVLSQRGALVEYCEVYRRRAVAHAPGMLAALLRQGLDVLTASSGETLQLLLDQAANDGIKAAIQQLPLVVPGDRVAGLARDSGFCTVIAAANAGVPAMLAAIDQLRH